MQDPRIQQLMREDENGEQLVTFARQTAETLVKNNLTRAQIRNIFTEVRQIEAEWGRPGAVRRLSMLKPKLSYLAARSSSVELLRDVLTAAIDQVTAAPEEARDERFERFVELFEAILAYHRSEGGRGS